MSVFAQRLEELLAKNDMTAAELSRKTGIPESAISNYRSGKYEAKQRRLEQLSKALHTTPAYLMGWEVQDAAPAQEIPPGFEPLPDMSKVPRVGRIACGQPILAEENIEDYDSIPSSWHATFTLLCVGDSMAPRIQDGDLVAIRKQSEVENGEIAAVRIDDEATLKRVFLFDDHIELRADNPLFPTIIRIGEAMNDVHIEGKAVGLCRAIV